MNSICIVGGGTAGFITALILKRKFPHLEIKVIKSDKIGIIGVGEGSTPHFDKFLKFVGLKQMDIIKECGVTYKTSIAYTNWSNKNYIHSVDQRILDKINDLNIRLLHLFNKNIEPIELTPKEHLMKKIDSSLNKPINQFHFNNFKLNTFFNKVALERGIEVIDDEITDVTVDQFGNIKMVSSDMQDYISDFYVDATGFKKVLFSKLDPNWVDVSKWLTLDSALVYQTTKKEVPNLWTDAHALTCGWKFKIPLLERQGNGYIFDSNFCNEDQAAVELDRFDPGVKELRSIKFKAGYLSNCWIRNCFATGLTSNFFEPLEASSIAISIQQAFMLSENLINYNHKILSRVNQQFKRMMENNRDFLILHYLGCRTDTPFWRSKRDMTLPGSLIDKLEISKQRLLILDDFSEDGQYALWKDHHYSIVMYGLGLLDKQMIKKQYDALPETVKKHSNFLDSYEVDYFNKAKYIYHDEWLREVLDNKRIINEEKDYN